MLKYRADIDGLRAIAVVLVLLFHLDVTLFSGGFIGVDIFFTISGFLISGIILKAAATGEFSFTKFYIKRATRLIPAYITVLAFTLLAGFFILTPFALSDLIESAIASSLFLSNIYFMFSQSGYFSSSTHEFPLLHTWSLSVEEQFYLIMPICMLVLMKIKSTRYQLITLIIISLVSFYIANFITNLNAKAAYYLIFSRAGEFLIGIVLATTIFYYPHRIKLTKLQSDILFTFSFSIIILCAIYIESSANFPGYTALLPCIATAGLLLAGQNEKCVSSVILGNRLFVFIGLISYSLYLWHWPIISYVKVLGLELNNITRVAIIFLSSTLAYCTWRFIENKTRYSKSVQNKSTAIKLYIYPCIILMSIFYFSNESDFYPQRFSTDVIHAEQALYSKPEDGKQKCHHDDLIINNTEECILGNKEKNHIDAILWGDSHASHFNGFVDVLASQVNLSVLQVSRGNCPPAINLFVNMPGARQVCIEKNKITLDYILKEKPSYVFLAGSWGGYTGGNLLKGDAKEQVSSLVSSLRETVEVLLKNNIRPVIFEMLPRHETNLSHCYLKVILNRTDMSVSDCRLPATSKAFPDIDKAFFALKQDYQNNVIFITPERLFCDNDICPNYIDSTPLYRDGNHLNMQGSIVLGKIYINSPNIPFAITQ